MAGGDTDSGAWAPGRRASSHASSGCSWGRALAAAGVRFAGALHRRCRGSSRRFVAAFAFLRKPCN